VQELIKRIERVNRSGIFTGLSRADIAEAGKKVKFKRGWSDFVNELDWSCYDVVILSVNWSESLIRNAVSAFVEPAKIYANEFDFNEHGVCASGLMLGDLRTGSDKLDILQGLDVALYVGDSLQDLPCLLGSPVGVIMGRSQSLLDACDKFAISVDDLAAKATMKQLGKRLYRTDDWHTIAKCLDQIL